MNKRGKLCYGFKCSLHTGAFRSQSITEEYERPSNISPKQYLTFDDPSRRYTAGVYKTTQHEGQLKLLLRLLQFMNFVCSKEKITIKNRKEKLKKIVMIYAGMASGRNMQLVSMLYPGMVIIGIDPADFDPGLIKMSKRPGSTIKLFNKFFTDETAKSIVDQYKDVRVKDNVKLLFVSDIRLEPLEERTQMDMKAQETWVNIMEPDWSLLKYRPPWEKRDYKYLPGTIQLQHFAPRTSTETGLIVSKADSRKQIPLDGEWYQNAMFYFNTITRVQSYIKWLDVTYGKRLLNKIPGLCPCNDCMGLVYTCRQYMLRFPGQYNDIIDFINDCIKYTLAKGINLYVSYIMKNSKYAKDRLNQHTGNIHIMFDELDKMSGKDAVNAKRIVVQNMAPIINELNNIRTRYTKLKYGEKQRRKRRHYYKGYKMDI
jgi:hypothetical protein